MTLSSPASDFQEIDFGKSDFCNYLRGSSDCIQIMTSLDVEKRIFYSLCPQWVVPAEGKKENNTGQDPASFPRVLSLPFGVLGLM